MDIVRSVRTLAYKGAGLAQRYAPEILTALGVAGVATSTVLIAKQTLRLEVTIDEAEQRIARAHADKANGEDNLAVVKAYMANTNDMVKLYGAPVMLSVASIASILAAHGIMRRRNAALVAAYGVLETAFANYRERVREAIGEDREQELYVGARETTEVSESGKKTVKKDLSGGPKSPYALLFDETNIYWEPEAGTNKTFLLIKQQHLNDKLNVKGYLFLNEVHRALGFPDTKAGQIVGWIADTTKGDGYVDLGIFEPITDVKRDFINGHERNIWLNPNVDGPIIDKLP